MEARLRKSSVNGGDLVLKEEKKSAESFSGEEEDYCSEEIAFMVGKGRSEQNHDNQNDLACGKKGHNMPKIEMSTSSELNSNASPLTQKEQGDQLKSAKAEMGEVIEENQRLRMCLDQIMKDYRKLQMQFQDIVQEEAANKPSSTITTHQDLAEEPELISLSLGRSLSGEVIKKEDTIGKNYSKEKVDDHEEEDKEGCLALGLDCKFELPKSTLLQTHEANSPNPSPEASLEEVKEEAGETWPPQKGLKTVRTGDDEVSQHNPAKRARVSVRVRCDTPTMNDGCQWRKYGQKIAKGNPCPRAYYRCTVAQNCPVRKQVQRCAGDMSILMTTYEGTHNHPLPISATAMASTTSAAACMLMSGSTTSAPSSSTAASSTLTSANLNGLNFYLSHDHNSRSGKPFYIPNSSMISSSSSFPTITLDLTTSSNSSSAHLSKLGNFPSRYNNSTTNLNFSSLESSSLPISWNINNGILNYGTQSYNKNQMGSLSFGRQQPQETVNNYQSYLQKNNILNSASQQNLAAETIAAATKAITSDPCFQSALAAALTSIIGTSGGSNHQMAAADKLISGQNSNLKPMSESFPVLSSFPPTSNNNVNKCAPSFFNKSSNSTANSNSQPGSLMFLSPNSLPLSTSTSKSTSPADNRDHIS